MRAAVSGLREITSKYGSKVSIVSIMADDTIETTRDAVRPGKMTWDVAWDGKDGPVATQWGIREFPTVFIFGPDQILLVAVASQRSTCLRS